MNSSYFIAAAIAAAVSVFSAHGQQTMISLDPQAHLKSGLELFRKKKFGAAQHAFEQAIAAARDPQSELVTEAEYHHALCAIELFNPDAEHLLGDFVRRHPESPRRNRASFQLGRYQFSRRSYRKALERFGKVDIYELSTDELAEYYFKSGYCRFVAEDFDGASGSFYQIRESASVYAPVANYYFSHIAYRKGNYETALQGFLRLTDDENFGPVVPYYISQIYYMQDRYDSLIAFATPLLDHAIPRRAPEIARLLGEAYYRTGRFAEALPYLEQFRDKAYFVDRPDHYQLGYAYYRTGRYEAAVKTFREIVAVNDSLTQSAYYHMGDALYRMGEKQQARNAFGAAAKLASDTEIQEDAAFNYAKLSYELSYNPFNKAIYAFRDFLGKYPASPRRAEVFGYLVNIFFTTRNYRGALEVLDSIRTKDPGQTEAYQLIACYRGMELYANGQHWEAVTHFEKSLAHRVNPRITAQCLYWMGEAHYRLGEFDRAIGAYSDFALVPGAFSMPAWPLSQYNLGYAHYSKGDYAGAIPWFRRFADGQGKHDRERLNDSYLRIADAYYINKDFYNALEYYNKAIATGLRDMDYALYQKAMASGVLSKYDDKIRALDKLLSDHRSSQYAPAAMFELANAYAIVNDDARALRLYDGLENEFPASIYVKDAMLRAGLLHRKNGDDERASGILRRVAKGHHGTAAAREALDVLKEMHIASGDAAGWIQWVERELPGMQIAVAAQDSITYEAAEAQYMKKGCAEAADAFALYLSRYPGGFFSVNASFYLAECRYAAGQREEALEAYRFVISKPKGSFTEKALANAADIGYDLGRYAEALELYSRLEETAESKSAEAAAATGRMRCLFGLKDYPAALGAAVKVLASEKVEGSLAAEARMIVGKSAWETGDTARALEEFGRVAGSGRTARAAEAAYLAAGILYLSGQYDASEKSLFALIDRFTSYDHWVTRSLILLADNYYRQGDLFQAKYTLQAVLDDYKGEDLLPEAREKLDRIVREEEEKKAEEKRERDVIEIDMNRVAPPDTTGKNNE